MPKKVVGQVVQLTERSQIDKQTHTHRTSCTGPILLHLLMQEIKMVTSLSTDPMLFMNQTKRQEVPKGFIVKLSKLSPMGW